MWVGQKGAAVHLMEMQLAQDEASQKTVGSNLGAGKVFHHGIFVKNYSLSSCVHSLNIVMCEMTICNELLCICERYT